MDRKGVLENPINPFPIDRLRENNRNIGKEIKLFSHVFHIVIEDGRGINTWLCEDCIPLIDDEDNPLLRFDRETRNMEILMRNTLECIKDNGDDVSTLDSTFCALDTPVFDIRRADLS